MATLRFNGHSYETTLMARIRWHVKRTQGVYDTPKPKIISHATGCCDYWITDADAVYRAVQDDTLITEEIV